jgi:hypothetical protein
MSIGGFITKDKVYPTSSEAVGVYDAREQARHKREGQWPSVVDGVEFVDWATNYGTMSVTRPATYASGDRLFIFMGSSSGSNISPVNPPAGGGFTQVMYDTGNVSGVWTKVMGASEPTSYLFTSAQNTDRCNWAAIVVRNEAGYVNGFNSTATAPSVTMPSAGILFCFFFDEGSFSYTNPTGMTLITSTAWSEASIGLSYEVVTAGATGTRSSNLSDHAFSVGVYE